MPRGVKNRKARSHKRRAGTLRRDRDRTSVRTESRNGAVPPAPAWLKREAREKWELLAPVLHKRGLLAEHHLDAFASMCMHWMIMTRAFADVARRGVMVRGARKKGERVKNPALQVMRENSTAFRAYSALFGLSPADSGRLDVPDNGQEHEDAEDRELLG